MKTAFAKKIFPRRAFTLIEIMIVVAIIGLIAAMGVPSLITALQKQGMRKAVSDLQDVCNEARARAINTDQTVAVIFHPQERRFEVEGVTTNADFKTTEDAASGKVTSAILPDGISIEGLDINLMDFSESDTARVRFFPNGTCDEMRIVLLGNGDTEMMSLDFATGILSLPKRLGK
jgi:prepilin-type N-terminal cleavage/methylation domain-containing protein